MVTRSWRRGQRSVEVKRRAPAAAPVEKRG
jgi:hypothetical protein